MNHPPSLKLSVLQVNLSFGLIKTVVRSTMMYQNVIGLMLKCCSVRAVSLFALFDVTTLKKKKNRQGKVKWEKYNNSLTYQVTSIISPSTRSFETVTYLKGVSFRQKKVHLTSKSFISKPAI